MTRPPDLSRAARERGTVLALLGVVLVALAMRAAPGVIGAVFPVLADDLGLDVVVLSILASAPPFGFAFAGLLVPAATRRLGLEGAIIGAVAVIAAGQLVRAAAWEPILLVASTFVTMVGIGAANMLLPPLVRRYAPRRIGLVTGCYLILMSISASTPAFVGVQLAEATGWRFAIGVWAVLPVVAVVPWIATVLQRRAAPAELTPPDVDEVAGVHEPGPVTRAIARPRRIAAAPTAWAIMATLVISSITIYAAMAFLPSMLIETAGVSPETAGAAVGFALILGIPQSLVVPLIASHRAAVIPLIATAGVCTVVGWLGMLFAPGAAPWVWAFALGSGSIVFPLALLLVNTRSRDPRVTVAVSAFAQGGAYLTAGLTSLLLGVVHELTGSWTVPFVVLAASAGLAIPAILILRRGHAVDDELG